MPKIFHRLALFRGTFAVLILTSCIQGGGLVSQFLTAFYLSSSEVGVIRAVESILAILVLGASVGTPTLAIRESAAATSLNERAYLLRRLLVMEMMVGVIAFVGLLAFHRLVLSNAIIGYASLIAGIAVLTNSVRVLAGFVQGTQTAPSVSVILIASTFGSVCVVTGVAHAYSISGWIAGRYLGEMIVLSALVWHLRGYLFRRPILVNQSLPSLTLISLGVSANVAQFVRLLCDNLPILGMTAAKVKTDQIGHFGLATLVLMGPTLIFAVIAQVELPQIVLVRTEHGAVARRMRRLMRSLLRSALLFSGIFIVIGVFNRLIFHFPIGDTLDLLIVLSMALPLRVTSLAIGTVLMALRQYKLSVYINSVEAVLTAPIAYYLAKQFGAKGAAIAFFLGSVLSLALHAGVLRASRLLSSNES